MGAIIIALLSHATICNTYIEAYNLDQQPDAFHRYEICLAVLDSAENYDMDLFMAASVAYEESRFGVDNEGGIRGPIQIDARYWCPDGTFDDCKLVDRGIRALKLLRRCRKIDWDTHTCNKNYKHPLDWEVALCRFGSGNTCSVRGKRYARRILRRASFIRKRHEGLR